MKTLLRVCVGFGVGVLVVLGGLRWLAPRPHTPALAVAAATTATSPLAPPDSADLVVTGVVGAGDNQPLMARTTGRVRNVFFSGGEYVRRGQLLVKLINHNFVVAPRAGFLGPRKVVIGQYLTRTTQVTTISKRSYLVVPVLLPHPGLNGVLTGDSAQVWVAARPACVVAGVVGTAAAGSPADSAVEIVLASHAPFRIGERVTVRLRVAR